ncbi:MAG: hypothetical protein ABIJ34_01045 [archaeon]
MPNYPWCEIGNFAEEELPLMDLYVTEIDNHDLQRKLNKLIAPTLDITASKRNSDNHRLPELRKPVDTANQALYKLLVQNFLQGTVLEAGCGTGYFYHNLSEELKQRWWMFDINSHAVEMLTQEGLGKKVKQGNIYEIGEMVGWVRQQTGQKPVSIAANSAYDGILNLEKAIQALHDSDVENIMFTQDVIPLNYLILQLMLKDSRFMKKTDICVSSFMHDMGLFVPAYLVIEDQFVFAGQYLHDKIAEIAKPWFNVRYNKSVTYTTQVQRDISRHSPYWSNITWKNFCPVFTDDTSSPFVQETANFSVLVLERK